jgi:flagellar protein FlgJ
MVESVGSFYVDNTRLSPSGLGKIRDRISGGRAFSEVLEEALEDLSPEPVVEGGSAPLNRKTVVDKTDKLYEQCEALETFLVKTLVTGMRNTIQKSEFLDGGFAGKMYEDMLYDEYAKDFTKNAGFGLAELAYLELTGQRGKLIANHP